MDMISQFGVSTIEIFNGKVYIATLDEYEYLGKTSMSINFGAIIANMTDYLESLSNLVVKNHSKVCKPLNSFA